MNTQKSKEYHAKVYRIRKSARRRLHKLVNKQDHKCYYCGDEIISRKEIECQISPKKVICVNKRTFTFLKEGNLKTVKVATAEHLVRIADGGDNSNGNLVAACYFCNNKKNREYFLSPDCNNRACGRCGSVFNGRTKNCSKCREFYKEFHLLLKRRKQVLEYLKVNKNDYY